MHPTTLKNMFPKNLISSAYSYCLFDLSPTICKETWSWSQINTSLYFLDSIGSKETWIKYQFGYAACVFSVWTLAYVVLVIVYATRISLLFSYIYPATFSKYGFLIYTTEVIVFLCPLFFNIAYLFLKSYSNKLIISLSYFVVFPLWIGVTDGRCTFLCGLWGGGGLEGLLKIF